MGYIKLDRKLKDWQWSNDPLMMALWIRLLLEANYQDTNWKGRIIPRGSLVASVKSLSEKTGLTIQQTRNKLTRMQRTNEITIKPTNKYSLITINKWEEYQCSDENPTNKPTNKRYENQQTNEAKSNNTKRNKEDKKNKKYIYKGSEEVNEALKDFKNMRNLKKKPLTDKAMTRLINKLEKLSGGDENLMIQILNQSTDNGWQDIYELKHTDSLPVYDTSRNKEMSQEEEEKLLKLMGRA